MSISLTLNQTSTATPSSGTATYAVTNFVTASIGISPAVFVFARGTGVFDHYATAADMSAYPDNPGDALAQNLNFYRSATVTRTWSTIDEMNLDLTTTPKRLQSLLNETSEIEGSLLVNVTTTLVAGT